MTASGNRHARRIPVGGVGTGPWWIEVNGDGRVGGKPAGTALADLDGDGRAALVSAHRGRDRLTVRLSRATVAQ